MLKPKSLQSRVYSTAVFALMLYHTLIISDFTPVKLIYYASLPLAALFLYKRYFKGCAETKVLLLFCGWIVLTRILNGDYLLEAERHYVYGFLLSAIVFSLCTLLEHDARDKFLLSIAIMVVSFFSLLSVFAMYTAVSHTELINPFNAAPIATFSQTAARLTMLKYHPNNCSVWFFISICMAAYLFLRTKNLKWRILIAAAAILNHFALALTHSRTMKLAFALSFAALISLVVLKYLPAKKLLYKILIVVLVLCLLTPLLYLGFDLSTRFIGLLSHAATPHEASALPYSPDDIYNNTRGFDDNGRFAIYKTVVPTLRQEPMRLLRGCMYSDIMSISNAITGESFAEFHNAALQTLVYGGIPALILMLTFLVLLAIKMCRLFFSDAPMHIKALMTVLLGTFVHNTFEASLFMYTDFRTQTFFLIAGAVVAYAAEYAPKKA